MFGSGATLRRAACLGMAGPVAVGSRDEPGEPDGASASGHVRRDEQGRPLYASLGRRAMARFIDMSIFFLPSVPVLAVLGPPAGEGASITPAHLASGAILFLLWGLYEVVLTVQRGRTVGKAATGIAVVRRRDGRLPGPGASSIRWLLVLLSYLLVPPSALIVLWASPLVDPGRRRQGWHDKVAGTVVVEFHTRLQSERSVWSDDED